MTYIYRAKLAPHQIKEAQKLIKDHALYGYRKRDDDSCPGKFNIPINFTNLIEFPILSIPVEVANSYTIRVGLTNFCWLDTIHLAHILYYNNIPQKFSLARLMDSLSPREVCLQMVPIADKQVFIRKITNLGYSPISYYVLKHGTQSKVE